MEWNGHVIDKDTHPFESSDETVGILLVLTRANKQPCTDNSMLYGCNWNELTCRAAAEGGHLVILQWAREKGCDWDDYQIR